MTRILRLVALGVLAGCTDRPEPTAVESESTPQAALATSVGATTTVPRGIVRLKDAWDAAFTAKNAAAYARNYTVQAQLVNPLGAILDGREAIRATHQFLFSGPLAGTAATSTIRRTVFLARDLRIVDLDVEFTGALPPGLPQVEPGVVRSRVKWIVVERHGAWRILDTQVTVVPPAS
jgi:uncharacterized protein (TIGR02246 family)